MYLARVRKRGQINEFFYYFIRRTLSLERRFTEEQIICILTKTNASAPLEKARMNLTLPYNFMFMNIKDQFLNPLASYQGEPSLAQYMFNANLQEFANKVDLLCALQTGDKLSAEDAYAEIRALWKELKLSNKNLLGELES
jgi:hypothetical protein